MFKQIRYIRNEINAGKKENIYSRFIYRKLSPYVTCLFIRLGISASATTWLSVAMAFIGCFLISFSDVRLTLIGLGFIHLWYLLDHVDGEIARLTKTATVEGKYLDVMLHNLVHPIIYFSYALDVINYIPTNYTDPIFALHFPLRRFILFSGFLAGLSAIIIDLSSTVRFSVILGMGTIKKISQEYSTVTVKLRNVHPVGFETFRMKLWRVLWHILCVPGAVIFLTIGSIMRINIVLLPVYAFFLFTFSILSISVRIRSKLDTFY